MRWMHDYLFAFLQEYSEAPFFSGIVPENVYKCAMVVEVVFKGAYAKVYASLVLLKISPESFSPSLSELLVVSQSSKKAGLEQTNMF